MRHLKSTSKYGQSLKSRASESKGSRKKELNKLARVDSSNFKKAPKSVQKKIVEGYDKRPSGITTKNNGRYI